MKIYRIKFNQYTICLIRAENIQHASLKFTKKFPGVSSEEIYIFEVEFDDNGIEVPHHT